MPPPSAAETLSPERSAWLAEFARACKAATRIVSMYPPSHPSIQAALARIAEASKQATSLGPFTITVLPDALVVGGRGLARPEPSAVELAALMHQQLIGEITLVDKLDGVGWHGFLSLLAKTPEEARALGGVTQAWEETKNGAITLKEIDYAEVLRERAGGEESASWVRILGALSEEKKELGGVEQPAMQSMLELASDPQRLALFAGRLQEHGKASGDDSMQQRKSLVELMHGLANYAAERQPEELDGVLDRMAGAAAQMSPEMLLTLITDPPPVAVGGPATGRLDLAAELQSRLTDEMVSKFLVDNVVKDRAASNRLAAAFHALAPEEERRRNILDAANAQAAARFGDDPQFESVWSSSTEMLVSYSDAEYVSDDYARELTLARTQPVDIERAGDDPPVRVRAWLSTVSEEDIRALDQRLVLDLLSIEIRPNSWASVLDLAINSIEQLVLVGDLILASQLIEAIVAISRQQDSPFAAVAADGVDRLTQGPLVRHLVLSLRQATDAEAMIANQMCRTIGPGMVGPLADALAAEDNARTVRRLRDILIAFGAQARAYADELRSSPNPAVRRAAIDLLRALGGDAALPDLRSMLDDTEPQVQREALRAIVQIGTHEAYASLEQALQNGKPHTREAILQSLGSLRDERAAPLFVYILTHTGYTGELEGVYMSSIESLGKVATDERSVATLKDILYRGEWWAPYRTSRIRNAVARALRNIGSASAERALEEAVANGSGGVKRAARAALAEPAAPRSTARGGQ